MGANMIAEMSAGMRPQPEVLDAFVEHYYEQVYTLCSMFLDDATASLATANRSFHACGLLPSSLCLFRNVVLDLGRNELTQLPMDCQPFINNAAWLLKDIAGLRYSEIAQVLGIGYEEVRCAIAACRTGALENLAV